MGFEKPKSGAERVAKRRAALRAQGLRPRTFWLPDTRTPEFQEQARQMRAWLWAHQDDEAMVFVDAMIDDVLSSLPPPWDDED
ncbi:antitoxin MazE family protein [Sphingomonas sp.]|uniref:antitoxin MazE family protein n=1 Tax=Sphingomonas sp. TaxID=28214 RepID=UPI002C34B8EA|nr:antitoxin MazE family protein [Sphingomonas sp.]HWK34921.1 antitoxin MazE family protein [Sphingomonas sp.]